MPRLQAAELGGELFRRRLAARRQPAADQRRGVAGPGYAGRAELDFGTVGGVEHRVGAQEGVDAAQAGADAVGVDGEIDRGASDIAVVDADEPLKWPKAPSSPPPPTLPMEKRMLELAGLTV